MPEIASITDDLPVDCWPAPCQYRIEAFVAGTRTQNNALRQRNHLLVQAKLLKLTDNSKSLNDVGAERSDLVMDGSVILW
jgi:hypothetical protein